MICLLILMILMNSDWSHLYHDYPWLRFRESHVCTHVYIAYSGVREAKLCPSLSSWSACSGIGHQPVFTARKSAHSIITGTRITWKQEAYRRQSKMLGVLEMMEMLGKINMYSHYSLIIHASSSYILWLVWGDHGFSQEVAGCRRWCQSYRQQRVLNG